MAESREEKLPFVVGAIADGVPLPKERTGYPWPDMKPGQSVVEPRKASSSARNFVAKYRRGWKVVEETVAGHPEYIRIWFVEDPDAEDVGVEEKELPGGLDRDEEAERAASEAEE